MQRIFQDVPPNDKACSGSGINKTCHALFGHIQRDLRKPISVHACETFLSAGGCWNNYTATDRLAMTATICRYQPPEVTDILLHAAGVVTTGDTVAAAMESRCADNVKTAIAYLGVATCTDLLPALQADARVNNGALSHLVFDFRAVRAWLPSDPHDRLAVQLAQLAGDAQAGRFMESAHRHVLDRPLPRDVDASRMLAGVAEGGTNAHLVYAMHRASAPINSGLMDLGPVVEAVLLTRIDPADKLAHLTPYLQDLTTDRVATRLMRHVDGVQRAALLRAPVRVLLQGACNYANHHALSDLYAMAPDVVSDHIAQLQLGYDPVLVAPQRAPLRRCGSCGVGHAPASILPPRLADRPAPSHHRRLCHQQRWPNCSSRMR